MIMSNKSLFFNLSDLFWFVTGATLIVFGTQKYRTLDRTFTFDSSETVATLREVSNLVKVKHQNDLTWVVGDEGQPLTKDALVFAGDFSTAKIDFNDGKQVVILPGSILRIFQNNEGKFKMQIKRGRAFQISESGARTAIDPTTSEISLEAAEEVTEVTPSAPGPELTFNGPQDMVLSTGAIQQAEFTWSILAGNTGPTDEIGIELRTPTGKTTYTAVPVNEYKKTISVSSPGRYDWMVKHKDQILDAGSFQMIKLHSPLIVGPKNEVLPNAPSLKLEWSYSSDESDFEVEVINGEEKFTRIVSQSFFLEIPLNSELPLKWKVRARSNEFLGPWSEVARLWPLPKETVPEESTKMTNNKETKSEKPLINSNAVARLLPEVIEVNELPFEVTMRNLEGEAASLATFLGTEQIKAPGEDELRFRVKRPGSYVVSWYQVEANGSIFIAETELQIKLKPIQDSIQLPEEIKVQIKQTDKK